MKYATLLFGTLLASIATAQAEPASIPTAYHGMWCNSDATSQKIDRLPFSLGRVFTLLSERTQRRAWRRSMEGER
jgi:hypothetical protein